MATLPRIRTSGAFLALTLALAACDGGGPSDIGQPLTIQVTGRLERGAVVTVEATAEGAALPPEQVQLSFSPADAVEAQGGGKFRLLRAARVTVSGTAPGRLGSKDIVVAAPPVVVFDRMNAGNRDIWRVDLDGQNLTRLTTHPGDDQDPTVARGRVVFVSWRDTQAELYQLPLAGGTETRLTTTGGNETTPALSSDGERLAFSYEPPNQLPRLWVAAGNATGAARATPDAFGYSGSVEGAPSWAPTGNRLVFTATALGTSDLFNLSLPASAAPTALTGGEAHDVEPAWSADGEWVAFTSNRAGGTDLYLLRISTGAVTPLAASPTVTEYEPTWTPDGRVVFTQAQGNTLRLRWVDPADPSVTYPIETGTGNAQRPAAAAPPAN